MNLMRIENSDYLQLISLFQNIDHKPVPINQFYVSKSTIHFKPKQKSQETKFRFDNKDLEMVKDLAYEVNNYDEQFLNENTDPYTTKPSFNEEIQKPSNTYNKKSKAHLIDYVMLFQENEHHAEKFKLKFSHSLSNQAKYFHNLKKIRRINNENGCKPMINECCLIPQSQKIARREKTKQIYSCEGKDKSNPSILLLDNVQDFKSINSKSYKSFMQRCTTNMKKNAKRIIYSRSKHKK